MDVGCRLLIVGCWLGVEGCPLLVVCCLLFVDCCWFFVAGWVLRVALFACCCVGVCRWLFVFWRLVCVGACSLFVGC